MQFKNYQIRQATNDDIKEIKNIVFNVLKEYGLNPSEEGKDIDLNDIETNYINKNGFFGIAIDNNTNALVGTFGLFPLNSETCELRKMYLVKSARGMGLGKFILSTAVEIAKERKFKKMVLETISPLREAISLYRHFGFKEITPKEINERVDQAFELTL